MPINANVSGGQQITANVGETKIDVAVSGGFGPSGTAGAAGQAASIAVGTVTTGAPGSSASVVNAGSSSAAVLNFVIPAGSPGATGATGATGPAGTTSWNGITDKPSTFAPSAHTHDDRYYTESEVDTLLAGKQAAGSYAASTHTHVAANISDFTSAVIAAAPPTTNASLLTSGTLPDARLSGNIARTSDVTAAVAAVVDASPASLDTLRELAQALGNDASFATTVTNALASKAPLSALNNDQYFATTVYEEIAAKAPIANPTFTGTVSGVTKSMVGLGNVDNTSDASKPISTATQTALDGKAAAVHTHALAAITDAGTAAARNVPATGNASSTQVVLGSDTRLTDSRTPTFHSHGSIDPFGAISASFVTAPASVGGPVVFDTNGGVNRGQFGSQAGTICQGNDQRLSDARTPTSHKSTHATGGSDALSPSDIGAASLSHTHSATSGDITGLATVATSGSAADLTGTLSASRLPSTTVTAGSYGSASSVGTFTVDSTGRLTAAGSTGIAISASAITSGTVAAARLGSGTADSSTYLRGDGTWATVLQLTIDGGSATTFDGGVVDGGSATTV